MAPTDTAQFGFASIALRHWRQFENVSFEIHPRLTVITGANASGKSTILGILGRHFDWNRAYSSSPFRVRDAEGQWYNVEPEMTHSTQETGESTAHVGEIGYASGERAEIRVPANPSIQQGQYDIQITQLERFPGVYLPSHRAVSGNYAPVPTIPTAFSDPDELFNLFTNELRTRWTGGWSGKSPQLALKESLIAAAVFGVSKSEYVDANAEAAAIWTGFQEVLTAVMPASLGFRRMRVRVPDIIVESAAGDFILDEASGGLSAIVEMSWQIFLRSRNHPNFSVVLDEPENHLHPSLQKQIMPSLLRAFPRVQFVVATHSPFVVTSTPDSSVFVLDYNSARKVVSRKLDYTNKASSADETLRRVLGVESTFPSWAEAKFDAIVAAHLDGSLSKEKLSALRQDLRDNGLESEYADAVTQLAAASDEEGNL